MDDWGPIRLEQGSRTCVSIGSVQVEMGRGHEEWHYRYRVQDEYSDWRTVYGCDYLSLRPAMPDAPVVIVPTEPVCVLRLAEFHFTLPISPWVQVLANHEGRSAEILLDIPIESPHRAWFGSTEFGEAAYLASLDPFAPEASGSGVNIPVQVDNTSPHALWFEQILVRVNELDIAHRQGELVTNPVLIVFKGTDQLSNVSVGALSTSEATRMLTPRRQSGGSDIIRKSFVFLRELTG